jgi:prepilin-type N-terminal cleavage/methylation domain-containing protein
MNRKKGFTLIELLVVIAIIALLVSILMPSLQKARELARRSSCGMNLGNLGKGISLYQSVFKEKYPAMPNENETGTAITIGKIDVKPKITSAASEAANETAFLTVAIGGNGSVNAYYLLVMGDYVQEEGFKCPSDDTFETPDRGNGELGFAGWSNLSYALQPTSKDYAARPGLKSKGSMIIAADQVLSGKGEYVVKAVGQKPGKDNTVNHQYEFYNVLLAGNSVKSFSRSKNVGTGQQSQESKVGYKNDDIFTDGSYTVGSSKEANDSNLMGQEP